MSIALERGGSRMEAAGLVRGVSCIPVFEPPDAGGDRSLAPAAGTGPLRRMEGGPGAGMGAVGRGEEGEDEATSSSSSIGRNSDSSGRSGGSDGEEDEGEAEVQSALKGPLDTTEALGAALPIRRGISKFYCGKSKSFTTLADISSSSCAKDLAKPENAYTRKRKNLLAFSINWDRRHCSPLRGAAAPPGGSVPKRPANSSRSSAVGSDGGSSSSVGREGDPPRLRPPLPPNNGKVSPPQRCHFSMRSFSLMDLQGATVSGPSSIVPSDKLQRGLH